MDTVEDKDKPEEEDEPVRWHGYVRPCWNDSDHDDIPDFYRYELHPGYGWV